MRILILLSAVFCILSCSPKKKQLSFYATDDTEGDSELYVAEEISTPYEEGDTSAEDNESNETVFIPFEEQNGVKLIDVMVNGQFTVKMILDSGCSGTLISIAEAKYLYEKGCITEEDILGTAQLQIADGSIVENMVINLRELVIGNQISCSNVTATVSANAQAPLLLGNEVLNRALTYSVDNVNKVIIFKL